MFWNKKKGDMNKLPDLPSGPRAAPSMTNYHNVVPQVNTTQARAPHEEFPVPAENRPMTQESSEEIHSLPSFPDSPMKKGFSQSAIKDAIETEEIADSMPPVEHANLPQLPEHNVGTVATPAKNPHVIEMEEWHPQTTVPSPPPAKVAAPKMQGVKQSMPANHPIFIKLDKFKSARESLEVVKEKLGEIDDLLKTIREVKMKEDHELSSWEKEIESIKARITHVNSEIFEGNGF